MVPLIIASVFQILAFIIGALYLGARMRRLASQETRIIALRDEIEALTAEFGKASAQAIGRLEALRSPRSVQENTISGEEARSGSEYRSRSTEYFSSYTPASASITTLDDTVPVALTLRDESRRSGQETRQGQTSPQNGSNHARTGSESGIAARTPREEAIELYRSGLGSTAIAARLGLSVAEVELISSLEEGRGD